MINFLIFPLAITAIASTIKMINHLKADDVVTDNDRAATRYFILALVSLSLVTFLLYYKESQEPDAHTMDITMIQGGHGALELGTIMGGEVMLCSDVESVTKVFSDSDDISVFMEKCREAERSYNAVKAEAFAQALGTLYSEKYQIQKTGSIITILTKDGTSCDYSLHVKNNGASPEDEYTFSFGDNPKNDVRECRQIIEDLFQ